MYLSSTYFFSSLCFCFYCVCSFLCVPLYCTCPHSLLYIFSSLCVRLCWGFWFHFSCAALHQGFDLDFFLCAFAWNCCDLSTGFSCSLHSCFGFYYLSPFFQSLSCWCYGICLWTFFRPHRSSICCSLQNYLALKACTSPYLCPCYRDYWRDLHKVFPSSFLPSLLNRCCCQPLKTCLFFFS